MSERLKHDNPFFIIGSGRCGSTLLRLILDGHSRIVMPPETWFLLDWTRRFDATALLTKSEVEEIIDLTTNHCRWPEFEINAVEFQAQARAVQQPTLRSLADLVFDEFRRREGCTRWGEKTPRYFRIIPELAKIFPDARFIHLVRDGRDVAKSFYDRKWLDGCLHRNTAEWMKATDAVLRDSSQLGDNRFLEVRYEDLVLETEATIGRICDFLGEEIEPAMLSWEGAVADKVPSHELHIHGKLHRQPEPADVGRWKRELTPFQVACVEAYIGDRLVDFGYERATSLDPLSAAALRAYCATALAGADFASRVLNSVGSRLLGARQDLVSRASSKR